MGNCCKNNYTVCLPIIGCCDSFWVDIPPGYEEADIIVAIEKKGITWYQLLLDNIDGMVEFPIDEMASGFFNPYGGPYVMTYIHPDTRDVISFSIGGETYDSVEFTFAHGTGDGVCSLDIFG